MISFYILVIAVILGSFLALASFAIHLFTPPQSFPKNIPTIAFYYALIPFFRDVDQVELYHQYLKEPLQRFGAVKLFFGGRWNILVRKPSYIAEVFKQEDVYAKSGNQVKLPRSLLAEYTGENIISAHGHNWNLYTSVIKPALQHDQDPTPIWRNCRLLESILLTDSTTSPSGVAVYGPLQRFTIANLSETLYGSSFESLQRPDAPLHTSMTKIKPTIFNPVFMNFPFLDQIHLKSRQAGRRLVRNFRDILQSHVSKGHNHVCEPLSHRLGCRLLGAHREGTLSDKELQDNLVSTFLAGHENPQLALMALIYLLGGHKETQDMVRREISTLFAATDTRDFEPTYAAIHDLPLLTSTIYEALRLLPPISQLINRRSTIATTLGNQIAIPAGIYLGYNCYSTNRDVDFWGLDANNFRPQRWGSSMKDINCLYRKANARGTFITFHGGRRACLGQKFAMMELRITMVAMIHGLEWKLDESWEGRMTPVSPLQCIAAITSSRALFQTSKCCVVGQFPINGKNQVIPKMGPGLYYSYYVSIQALS